MKQWTRRRLPLLFLSVVALMGLSVASAFADQRDFTLHNNSSSDINNLYVGPSSSSDWGPDILGQDTLPAGSSVPITFTDATTTCNWDIEIVTTDGSQSFLYNQDLCSTTDVNFHD